ncbi:hypothetical protein EDD22DRAFT_1050836 [Suillus occidentalis]|nr:hypothetical protein EDD22DRAFT_1050836 [Suillus occidentalis]
MSTSPQKSRQSTMRASNCRPWHEKVTFYSTASSRASRTSLHLAHAYYILTGGGLKEVMSALVEASLSLIIANLSVVVAVTFRLSAEDEMTSTSSPIITFGSQPRKRVRDPGVLSTPVKFMFYPDESRVGSIRSQSPSEQNPLLYGFPP